MVLCPAWISPCAQPSSAAVWWCVLPWLSPPRCKQPISTPQGSQQDSPMFPKSIPVPFKSRLHESLYLREGCPRDLAPSASSPYSRSFGMRLSSMRHTCPSHLSRRWARRAKMDGSPARSSTSVLGTKSCRCGWREETQFPGTSPLSS